MMTSGLVGNNLLATIAYARNQHSVSETTSADSIIMKNREYLENNSKI